MADLAAPLVLGSGSPRRRELLAGVGIPFTVQVSDVDETPGPDEAPNVYVTRMARDKATAVAALLDAGTFVLGADTTVVVDGDVLGKPASDAEGRAMILRLAARAHEVTTAVCLAGGGSEVLETIAVTTRVRFRAVDPDEADRYVATGEGRDKAGGYGVQGLAAGFVEAIEGSYANVVGLPVVETLALLQRHGVLRHWP